MKLGSFTVSVTAVAAVLGVVLLEAVAAKRSKRPLVTEGCPKCDRGACPKVRRAQCPSLELVKDPCGCCKICASGLEERCGGFVWAEGVCGKGMVCVKYMQQFRAQVEYGEAGTCSCGDKESVCGADGRLYDDICHLRKENNERKDRGEPKVAETKMRTCGGAPKIKTRPENIQTGENGQFYLACEGEGIPIPEIYWTRDRKKLPSDEGNVSIQVRGGPMKNCVSSWVMVSTAMQKDAGEYICHVENNEGKANATATVTFQTS